MSTNTAFNPQGYQLQPASPGSQTDQLPVSPPEKVAIAFELTLTILGFPFTPAQAAIIIAATGVVLSAIFIDRKSAGQALAIGLNWLGDKGAGMGKLFQQALGPFFKDLELEMKKKDPDIKSFLENRLLAKVPQELWSPLKAVMSQLPETAASSIDALSSRLAASYASKVEQAPRQVAPRVLQPIPKQAAVTNATASLAPAASQPMNRRTVPHANNPVQSQPVPTSQKRNPSQPASVTTSPQKAKSIATTLEAYESRLDAMRTQVRGLMMSGTAPSGLTEAFLQTSNSFHALAERAERMAMLSGMQATLKANPGLTMVRDPQTGLTFNSKTIAMQVEKVRKAYQGAAGRYQQQMASLEKRLSASSYKDQAGGNAKQEGATAKEKAPGEGEKAPEPPKPPEPPKRDWNEWTVVGIGGMKKFLNKKDFWNAAADVRRRERIPSLEGATYQ
ncbi:hypothetical protein SAMN06265795_101204 [Noviherbaspirillum humi]|uniref:Uncharacterized protein n=1 Tax=Noviherbaspirillum humi TaxID=1688639 RepID=A0A239C1F2_9BURK|nr:hypothetical protein [Noviherbaspirillum humi]SNS13960.1 hypothetical protein SAMN06265795_101204 [Noviherbaspirillum humi]